MNTKNSLLLTILIFQLLLASSCFAQLKQAIRGQILQQRGEKPVAGAIVVVENNSGRHHTTADSLGKFELASVPPGYYRLVVRHLGFAPYAEPELEVEASKSIYRRILLQEAVQAMQEVEIAAPLIPDKLEQRAFTVAQTQRYPATFFDPARLVLSQPGVTQANDQANHVSVHGLSPSGIQWRLQGLPVLNPNHLSNAGTRRDRATASGGGVNMLSGQLMANSSFRTGALPPPFGNALSGVFDIQLRPGNLQEREHTLQASLLGIDLATEGPLRKGNSAYLVNYRYSTVGLLSQLGVDFGGEKIQFQDLSAHLSFEHTPIGQLNIFLLGGTNSNSRSPLENEADWEQDKDRQQIDFNASMGAIGLSQSAALGHSTRWHNGIALSAQENERTERWTGPTQAVNNTPYDLEQAQQLSAFSRLYHTFNSRLQTETGMQLIRQWASIHTDASLPEVAPLQNAFSHTLLQPYVQVNYAIFNSMQLEGGLRLSHLNWRNHSQLEPYAQWSWQPTATQNWQLSYSRLSQVYSNQLLARQESVPSYYNGLMDSHYWGLDWSYRLSTQTTLSTTLYYQQLRNIPTTGKDLWWNRHNDVYAAGSSSGSGNTYGIDLNLMRSFYQHWYYQFSTSLFDATFKNALGETFNSPLNSQWAVSLTTGREWTKEKASGERKWGLHLRLHSRGGYWYTPIDEAQSRSLQIEVEDTDRLYSEQFPVYYTGDLRLSHTRQKQGYTRIWSLDIQNLTNRRNTGWYYFDFHQQEINSQEQLGIIPVLAYRIQF